MLRNQVKNDNVGVDVLTPLRLADGTAVLVDRGWVRASATSGVTTDPPPGGTAVVHGLVHHVEPARGAGHRRTTSPTAGIAVPRVDLAAIGRTLPYKLLPVWIEAQAIEPTPHGNAPALPQPPPPDPVNHMEYAIEWFAFALIPLVGWPIALRRLLRQRKPATSSTHREHRQHDAGREPQLNASGAGRAARDRRSPRAPRPPTGRAPRRRRHSTPSGSAPRGWR